MPVNPHLRPDEYLAGLASGTSEEQRAFAGSLSLWRVTMAANFRMVFELWILLDHIGEKVAMDPDAFSYVHPQYDPEADARLAEAFGGPFLARPFIYGALSEHSDGIPDEHLRYAWNAHVNKMLDPWLESMLNPVDAWAKDVEVAVSAWHSAIDGYVKSDGHPDLKEVPPLSGDSQEKFFSTLEFLREELGIDSMLAAYRKGGVPIEDVCPPPVPAD